MRIGYDFPRFFGNIVYGGWCDVGFFKEIFFLNNQHLIFFFGGGLFGCCENGTFDVDSMKNCII